MSEKDKAAIEALRNEGILLDVEAYRLDQKNGVILISCADGDQMCDIFAHQVKAQIGQCKDPRIHTFGWNGGALRLAPKSRANKPGRSTAKDLLEDVRDARRMKNINTIALYVHAPCGKANACDISVIETLNLLMAAKEQIKKENDGVKVACFFHVDYANEKKRTYFISRHKWLEKRKEFVF